MTEIEEFCKRAYEDIVMSSIMEKDCNFVYTEIDNDSYVHIIKMELDSDYVGFIIYTERNGALLESGNMELKEELKSLLNKYNVDSLFIEYNIREWYDSYLVPRIRQALDVMEL